MARARVSKGEETQLQQFRLGQTDSDKLDFHANRLGKTKAEILRILTIAWIGKQNRHAHKLAVAKRAKKGAQKAFPLKVAAAKLKKQRS